MNYKNKTYNAIKKMNNSKLILIIYIIYKYKNKFQIKIFKIQINIIRLVFLRKVFNKIKIFKMKIRLF